MRILFISIALLYSLCATAQRTFNQQPTVQAAQALLHSLSDQQKAKANLPFSDSSRTRWSNFPMEQVTRKGLWFKDLTDTQKIHVHTLLRTVLSVEGYQKVLFIMQYDEDIRTRLTAANSPISHRYGHEKYWITVFGTPTLSGTWGWKFEGHHISLNFTHSPSGVSCTPLFVGINPALTLTGPFAGRYLLQPEHELGKQLFSALSPALRQRATIGPHPTNADPLAQKGNESFIAEKTGIGWHDLNKSQQALVWDILANWVNVFTPALQHEKMTVLRAQASRLRFAWMGTDDPNALHYYRIWSPSFTLELTNRDGGLQHLHTLFRILPEDFGGRH